MLLNYLKLALKVLKRRPFYTFISLFGISFSLMILMLFNAFYEHSIGSSGEMKNFDKVAVIFNVKLSHSKHYSTSTAFGGYYLLNEYARKLKTPELLSIASMNTNVLVYHKNHKLEIGTKYVDDNYWKIFSLKFLKGRPFNKAEEETASQVAVIDCETSTEYFGSTDVIGQAIQLGSRTFTIVGVVENVSPLRYPAYANAYLPLSTCKEDRTSKELIGFYTGYLLAKNKSDIKKINDEWQNILNKMVFPNPDQYNQIDCVAGTNMESVGHVIFGGNNSGFLFKLVLTILALLFMLIPTLNLVNLNITRILERSSEIGIRKSFGASSRVLVYQFLVENMVLTFIGGAIGLFFAYVVMKIVDASHFIPNSHFAINFNMFLFALMVTAFFGILSGVYPAFKMSKMNIVNALKEEKL